ncbi:MAG: transcription termination/antitermination protein NusA [Rickettsiales bacterium]
MRQEIFSILEELSKDTYISKEDLIKILENVSLIAARKKYGNTAKLKTIINRKTGEIEIYHERLIVNSTHKENNLNKDNSLDSPAVSEANCDLNSINKIEYDIVENYIKTNHPNLLKAKYTEIAPGEIILFNLPSIKNDRELATIVKKEFLSQVRIMQNERQYEEFSDKVGEIFYVTVKQISRNNRGEPEVTIVIDSKSDAILRKSGMIPGETFSKETKIFVYLMDVKHNEKQNQLVFTRTNADFVAKLLEKNVYEIKEKSIEIAAIARVPGFKTKIAVKALDSGRFGLGKIDPVYACIGRKGSIVKEIINELNGEKIDIFRWSDDIKEFIKNAMAPIVPSNINIINNLVEIIVPEEIIAQAIGTQGSNIKLLSNLLYDKRVHIMTESQAQEAKIKLEENRVILCNTLEIDDITSNILIINGLYNIVDIINSNISDLYNIDGISAAMMDNIILKSKYAYAINALEELGLSQDLFDILLTLEVDELLRCIKLASADILTKEQFNHLSIEQFKTIVFDTQLSDKEINELLQS